MQNILLCFLGSRQIQYNYCTCIGVNQSNNRKRPSYENSCLLIVETYCLNNCYTLSFQQKKS